MYGRSHAAMAVVILAMFSAACGARQEASQTGAATSEREVQGGGSFDDLVALFEEFRVFHEPVVTDGVPDYSAAAMARQYRELGEYQRRLAAFDISDWPISQRVDYHLVRAEMNGLEFYHRVMKPWSTDPNFYWGSATSTGSPFYGFSGRPPIPEGPGFGSSGRPEMPLGEEELEAYRARLRPLPKILAQGKANIAIAEAKRDMGLIALRSMVEEGVLVGEMVPLMQEHHPELVADTEAAWAAVQDYRAWIEENLDNMTAPTGVGTENFNWWWKNVWLIPYTWEEAWTITSEMNARGMATLKLEQYRNRDLPRLEPATSEAEYYRRWSQAEDDLMRFLEGEEFLTLSVDALAAAYAAAPPAAPARLTGATISTSNVMGTRSGAPLSFGDHTGAFPLYAIIHENLGHQLDGLRPRTDLSPIRATRRLYEMTHARREGVAVGMAEILMHAGILDERPRVREIFNIITAQTGSRGIAALRFIANELDYEAWNRYEAEISPNGWIIADEGPSWNAGASYQMWDAKRDAVRAPGYEVVYAMGVIQFQKLLADGAAQLGEDFNMRDFMDQFFSAGQIPMALIRWEMTGLTDEMEKL